MATWLCAPAPAPAAADEPTPGGVYAGQKKRPTVYSAGFTVDADGRRMRLTIAFRARCATGGGPLRPAGLQAFDFGGIPRAGLAISPSGRFRVVATGGVPRGARREVLAGSFRRNGREVSGSYSLSLRQYSTRCSAKFSFTATRRLIGKALQPTDAGTYVGTTSQGQPISFTLAHERRPRPAGTFTLRDLAFTATMRCTRFRGDGEERDMTVRLGGIAGKVPNDGVIAEELETPPQEDHRKLSLTGTVLRATAKGEIDLIGADVDANGNPTPGGEFSCEGMPDGERVLRFTAKRR